VHRLSKSVAIFSSDPIAAVNLEKDRTVITTRLPINSVGSEASLLNKRPRRF
jgi:hypothetical protein